MVIKDLWTSHQNSWNKFCLYLLYTLSTLNSKVVKNYCGWLVVCGKLDADKLWMSLNKLLPVKQNRYILKFCRCIKDCVSPPLLCLTTGGCCNCQLDWRLDVWGCPLFAVLSSSDAVGDIRIAWYHWLVKSVICVLQSFNS